MGPRQPRRVGHPLRRGGRPRTRGRQVAQGRSLRLPIDLSDQLVAPSRRWPTSSPSPADRVGARILRLGRPPLQRRAGPCSSTATRSELSRSQYRPLRREILLVPAHQRRQPLHRRRLARLVAPHRARRVPRTQPALPRRGGPRCRPARLRRRAHPDRNVVRGRLVDGGGAAVRDRAAQVPGGVPPGPGAADAGRPAGRHAAAVSDGRVLVNIVRGGDGRAARFGDWSDKESATCAPASSCTSCQRAVAQESVDFKAPTTTSPSRARQPPNPIPRIYFGGASERRSNGSPPKRRRVPPWGEPPRAGVRAGRACANSPRSAAGTQSRLRRPVPRHHAARLRRRLGGGRRTRRAA